MATNVNQISKAVTQITAEQIEQLQKDGYIVTNLSNQKREEEGEVLCKMAIKGNASKLRSIVESIICSLYQSSGNYTKGFDTYIKLTLMIEKAKEDKKTE